jgi:hypothetical protein
MSDEDLELAIVSGPQQWWDDLMARYVEEAAFDELRRFICLWVSIDAGANPEKVADLAAKQERFLKGTGPRAVE